MDEEHHLKKSDLVATLSEETGISKRLAKEAVDIFFEMMSKSLERGDRIEIRGFGSFSLHYRSPRTGRNPKTGDSVQLSGKYVPHFKPGKELREQVDESKEEYPE